MPDPQGKPNTASKQPFQNAKVAMAVLFWMWATPAHSLTNGLALVPPMGWNTWYCFYGDFDASTIRGIADAMTTNGLKEAGYNYINLDDCYWGGRDSGGNMIVDSNRFPGGIRALADYVHSKDFKFGIYANASTYPTSCRVPAIPSYGHESNDVTSFIEWDIDFLKLDFLGAPFGPAITESAESAVTRWSNLLRASPRPVMFSLSGGYIEGWKPQLANLFRISGDINSSWTGVTNNLDYANRNARMAGRGRWNDPDMLFIGVNPNMTDTEYRAFFSLWCIIAAPLILSTDVRSMTPATKAIVTAPELIAVNQDPLGVQGMRVTSIPANNGSVEVWSKPLSSINSKAVALFNRGSAATNITVHWKDILLRPGPAKVRDLWAREDLGVFTNSFTTNVPPHGAVTLNITGNSYGPPVYVSSLSNRTSTGTVSFDRSHGNYFGFPVLSLAYTLYPRGIGMVAPASVTYDLSGFAETEIAFVSDLGLDMDSYGFGTSTFQIWADGVKLLERGPFTAATAVQTVILDITGRQSLQLVVLGSGNADWADARILAWTQPQLTKILRQADGDVMIQGGDAAGAQSVLLQATNLQTPNVWSPVETNVADPFGNLTFPNRPAQLPQSFYQLRRKQNQVTR